jgi:hypothetical protein
MAVTLKAHYGLLNETTATSETPVPAKIQSRPGFQNAVQSFGLDLTAARMASLPNGTEMWLIPGSSGYSYIVGNPADGFMRAGSSVVPSDGFLGFTSLQDGKVVAGGLVPDGNSTVTLTAPSGSTTTAAVTDNAFSASASGSGASGELSLTGVNGAAVSFAVGVAAPAS